MSLLIECLQANNELSPVSDTSGLLKKLIYLINKQYLCGECLKPVTIQYLLPAMLKSVLWKPLYYSS